MEKERKEITKNSRSHVFKTRKEISTGTCTTEKHTILRPEMNDKNQKPYPAS